MAKTFKYLALGKKAGSFWDPTTKLNITGNEVVKVPAVLLSTSGKIKRAIAGGHLVHKDLEAYENFVDPKTENQEEPSEAMIAYQEEIKRLSKLKNTDLIDWIEDDKNWPHFPEGWENDKYDSEDEDFSKVVKMDLIDLASQMLADKLGVEITD